MERGSWKGEAGRGSWKLEAGRGKWQELLKDYTVK
jgi:hypothetical protein